MSEQQRPQLLAMLGKLTEFGNAFRALSVEDMQWIFQNTKDAIALFVVTVKNRTEKITEPLFEFVTSFQVPGAKEFVAKEKFVVDRSEKARVRISCTGPTFKRVMLSLVERNIEPCELKLSKLRRSSFDLPQNGAELGTIAGLGGLDVARLLLQQFYEMLAYKQATGNLTWTVGYIRDNDGVLWAVDAYWRDDGWGVGADSVGNPSPWGVGCGFVSR